MLDNVLVPLDGSQLATCVFPHLIALTQATDAHITLLRVTEKQNEAGQVNPVDWHLTKMEGQLYLDEMKERLHTFIPQAADTQVLEGPVAERIIEYTQKNAENLVVLSTHGQSGLNGWPLSSVTQKVIQRAGTSILLIPAYGPNACVPEEQWADMRYRRIMVPLDGSQRAEAVLPLAMSLAQQHQAELILVHVITRPEMIQRMPLTPEDVSLAEQVVAHNQAQAQRYFEQLQSRLMPETQTKILVNGHATSALLKFVQQEQIDLVLLSAHGSSGQNQWPYGSVVTSLINHGATPLLILQDLPAHEIEPTQAERATNATQRVWRKTNHGPKENYSAQEFYRQNSLTAPVGHISLLSKLIKPPAERVSASVSTALL